MPSRLFEGTSLQYFKLDKENHYRSFDCVFLFLFVKEADKSENMESNDDFLCC